MLRFTGAPKRAALAVLACLVVLVGGGAAVALQASAATTDFGPGTVRGALVRIDASSPRSEYTDANGIHHCLPTGPNSTFRAIGDYPNMWFTLADPNCDFGASTRTAAPVDVTPAVKRETNVTVNVDFDATKPITVTGLPAYRAGSPELWGDNTGSITDSATDIVVKRLASSATVCPAAGVFGVPPVSTLLDVNRAVGSAVQKFCAYPKHFETGSTGTTMAGFVAGQSYKLNVWVYAP